VPAFKH